VKKLVGFGESNTVVKEVLDDNGESVIALTGQNNTWMLTSPWLR
jgi:hypothetical protein